MAIQDKEIDVMKQQMTYYQKYTKTLESHFSKVGDVIKEEFPQVYQKINPLMDVTISELKGQISMLLSKGLMNLLYKVKNEKNTSVHSQTNIQDVR
jgi:uncharacterized membrane-anchored protein YhcB (DUF1043 family)